jgi:hypothetical protein
MFWFWLILAVVIVAGVARGREIAKAEDATKETARLLRELSDRH